MIPVCHSWTSLAWWIDGETVACMCLRRGKTWLTWICLTAIGAAVSYLCHSYIIRLWFHVLLHEYLEKTIRKDRWVLFKNIIEIIDSIMDPLHAAWCCNHAGSYLFSLEVIKTYKNKSSIIWAVHSCKEIKEQINTHMRYKTMNSHFMCEEVHSICI